jgi:hypothetical protein
MPITFDTWTAMRDGPLLSATYNIITSAGAHDGHWNNCIRTQGCDVVLMRDPGDDDLSPAEEDVIAAVFQKYGQMDQREVAQVMQALPEWQLEWRDLGFQSPVNMDYATVLRANGATEEDISGFFDNLQTQELMSQLTRAA